MNTSLINLFIALLAIPADILMIKYLINEKVANGAKEIRMVLLFLFFSIFSASFINILFYILRELDVIVAHPFANIRSIFTNLVITVIAWVFVGIIKKLRD